MEGTETMSNYNRVDFELGRRASVMAHKIASVMKSYSTFIDPAKEQSIPKFDRDEIILGNLLGSGGFNNVFEVHQIELDRNDGYYKFEEQIRRQSFAEKSTTSSFAIKFLQPEVMEHKEDFCNAAADLVIETKILANLPRHPNIIQLHGVSADGIAGFTDCNEGGYFLILDRVYDTLSQRMNTWKRLKNTSLMDRVAVALSLSNALRHLHEHRVIFRDLKPDNVGFDGSGTLKLFDFGLAKELNPSEYNTDDTYEMSGQTGSRRYMAPEVARSQAYNLSADVYSFSVVMWQMCALRDPFEDMTVDDHMHHVVMGNERPLIDPEWPNKVRNIMKWCWSPDIYVRPPMKEVYRALRRQVKESQDAGQQTLNDVTSTDKRKFLMRQAQGQHSYQSLVSVLSGVTTTKGAQHAQDTNDDKDNSKKSKSMTSLIPSLNNKLSSSRGLKNVLEEASRISADQTSNYKKLPTDVSEYNTKLDGRRSTLSKPTVSSGYPPNQEQLPQHRYT